MSKAIKSVTAQNLRCGMLIKVGKRSDAAGVRDMRVTGIGHTVIHSVIYNRTKKVVVTLFSAAGKYHNETLLVLPTKLFRVVSLPATGMRKRTLSDGRVVYYSR